MATMKLVARGNPDDVSVLSHADSLPHGTKVRVEFNTRPGAAYLANIWGSEWVLNKFAVEGMHITNARSDGNSRVIADGYVNSPGVALIVKVLLPILVVLGVAYVILKLFVYAAVETTRAVDELFGSGSNFVKVLVIGAFVFFGGVAAIELLRSGPPKAKAITKYTESQGQYPTGY